MSDDDWDLMSCGLSTVDSFWLCDEDEQLYEDLGKESEKEQKMTDMVVDYSKFKKMTDVVVVLHPNNSASVNGLLKWFMGTPMAMTEPLMFLFNKKCLLFQLRNWIFVAKITVFKSNTSLGILGNELFVTVEGPPDKIIPFTLKNTFFFFKSFKVRTSDKTEYSLILLAINLVT